MRRWKLRYLHFLEFGEIKEFEDKIGHDITVKLSQALAYSVDARFCILKQFMNQSEERLGTTPSVNYG